MAKRNDPVARARGRKAAPVKKPFPTGMVAGVAVLALFLGGILFYAVKNTGVGDTSSLKYAQTQISGLSSKSDLTRSHIAGKHVTYPDQGTTPPDGGDHNDVPQSCQVYTEPVAPEHAVHSLEHGAVWVTYQPGLPGAEIAKLKKRVDGDPYRLMSPYPGQKSPISLQAWGEQVDVSSASDTRVERFLDLFTSGPQSPERSAPCSGTSATATQAEADFAGGTVSSTAPPAPGSSAPPSGAPAATQPAPTPAASAPAPAATPAATK